MGSRVAWHSETTPWSRWSVGCLATMWRGQVCPGFHDLVREKCMLRQTWDERQSWCSAKAVSQGDFDNKNVFGSSVALVSYISRIFWCGVIIISEPTKQSLAQGDMFRSHFWLGLSVIGSTRDTSQVSAEDWKVRQSSTVGFIKPSWPCRNPCENHVFFASAFWLCIFSCLQINGENCLDTFL